MSWSDLVGCEYDDETDDDGGEEEDADGEEHLATSQLDDRSSDDRSARSVVDVVVRDVTLHHDYLRLHARSLARSMAPPSRDLPRHSLAAWSKCRDQS